MISGGDAPAIIPKTYHPDEEAYASGAILPVDDYLELMPNFQDRVKEVEPGRRPGAGYAGLMASSISCRACTRTSRRSTRSRCATDVLTSLNLTVPKTWDELRTVLKAMKTANPDKYPFSDRWSIPTPTGCLLNDARPSYGTAAGWGYANATFDTASSKYVFTGAMDQYKQMLRIAPRW